MATNERLNILMVDPWGIRGPGMYTYSLCSELHALCHLTLITNCYYEFEKQSQFTIKKLFFRISERLPDSFGGRKLIRGVEYLLGLIILLGQIWRHRLDVVHFQWLLFYPLDTLFLKVLVPICKHYKVKLVLTVHDVIPHVSGELYIPQLKKIYPQFDQLIVHTSTLKAQLCNLFGDTVNESNIAVIPHGNYDLIDSVIDNQRVLTLQDQFSLFHQIERYSRVFLFIGTIHRSKGLDLLLHAWDKAELSNAILLIVGQPKYDFLDKVKAMHKTNIGLDLGYKSNEEMKAYYSLADVILLPYLEASQSGVLYSSLSYSLPVIATDVGEFKAIITEDIGWIVPPNNVADLSSVLCRVNKTEKEELIQKGIKAKAVSEKFSWQTIADTTLSTVYQK
ncbi:MAG: glycosyltransferase family 4 protein [Sporomusaceae bacterium]|nr:glycosyltransferase family 4 protein [Sporomusaceae bacterium]